MVIKFRESILGLFRRLQWCRRKLLHTFDGMDEYEELAILVLIVGVLLGKLILIMNIQ